MSPVFSSLLPYALVVVALFFGYGTLVRRGTIGGKAVIGAGILVTVVATGLWTWATFISLPPLARSQPTVWFGPLVMALCGAFCVWTAYRAQRVETLGVYQIGDTRITVLSCAPQRLPGADALLLPVPSNLSPQSGAALTVSLAIGGEARREARRNVPLQLGRSVRSKAGSFPIDAIWWVAAHEASKNTDRIVLQKAVDNGAAQAAKGGAEALLVALYPLRGLSLADTTTAIADGVLKQRRAFAEIVFVVLELRDEKEAQKAVEAAVERLLANPVAPQRKLNG